MGDELIRVIITKRGLDSGYDTLIKKGPMKMTSIGTFTRWGARRSADKFLKTRGKYTHPVQYVEAYL